MSRSDVKIDVYLDTPEEKRDLRSKAGFANKSMTAFANAIIRKALRDPIFLQSLYDESHEKTIKSSESKSLIKPPTLEKPHDIN